MRGGPSRLPGARRRVRRRDRGARPGAAVLEVGCGTGQLTERLAWSGFRLTAIDIGPSMVAGARRGTTLTAAALARHDPEEWLCLTSLVVVTAIPATFTVIEVWDWRGR